MRVSLRASVGEIHPGLGNPTVLPNLFPRVDRSFVYFALFQSGWVSADPQFWGACALFYYFSE